MILPHSNAIVLLLMVLGLLSWGSWVALFKAGSPKRWEIFYLDFAVGVSIAAVVCAFTLGSMGFDGFTVMDDILNAGRHQILDAFIAGALFNVGNMLMMAAVVVAGMALAFPAAFAASVAVAGGLGYLVNSPGRNEFLIPGAALLLAAIVAAGLANSRLVVLRHEALARAGKARSTRRPTSRKGLALAVAGGLVMGTAYPMLTRAQVPEIGAGPYATAFAFCGGLMVCTSLLTLLFMNLPVEGEPLEILDIFRTSISHHLAGMLSGGVWFAGLIAILVAASSRAEFRADPALSHALAQGAPVIAALWGLVAFRELRGGDGRARILAALTFFLFVLGLALVSLTHLPPAA